jgi:hypothetical protein
LRDWVYAKYLVDVLQLGTLKPVVEASDAALLDTLPMFLMVLVLSTGKV